MKNIVLCLTTLIICKNCYSQCNVTFEYEYRHDKDRFSYNRDTTLNYFSIKIKSDKRIFYCYNKDTFCEYKTVFNGDTLEVIEIYKTYDTITFDSIAIIDNDIILSRNDNKYKLFSAKLNDTTLNDITHNIYPTGRIFYAKDTFYNIKSDTIKCYLYYINYDAAGTMHRQSYNGIMLLEKKYLLPMFINLNKRNRHYKWYTKCLRISYN